MKEELSKWLDLIKKAAVKAGEEIMNVYNSTNMEIESKSDDSPLTLADRKSHEKIMEYLQQTDLPILSEEGKHTPYEERKTWEYFWLVDPLDGTKEFIKRNGEFTVNIALIKKDTPVMGVVYVPVKQELFFAASGKGAFKQNSKGIQQELHISKFDKTKKGIRVVGSRSHMSAETEDFIKGLHEPEIVSMGSSLKFMVLAEGKADVYPRFAPTMEWDTGAAHAIVLEAGGKVLQHNSDDELVYNKENLLNPWFLVRGN